MTGVTSDPGHATCPTCGKTIIRKNETQPCPRCLLRMALGPNENTTVAGEPRLRQVGDYVLGRQLGAGGMGVVYEARRMTDGRSVAVKLIRDFDLAAPTALRRFMIEAEAVARLDHPNIVRIHEVDEHEGQPFLAMDLVEGESLNAMIQSECEEAPQLTQRQIASLLAKISRAVHHAHSRGVLHRDIKPGNILVNRDGEPRLTDFGLAKIARSSSHGSEHPTLTTSADAPGTPSFMSPEQVTRGDVTSASDIYGLGAVLYALIAGRPPFEGATPLELFKQIAEQRPARPKPHHGAVQRDLETICLKCLEKDPRHRYGSALLLAEDLEHFAAGRAIGARRAGPVRRVRHWARRNPLGAALIVILCLGLSVSLALLKVVNTQRREIELDRDQAFDESMQTVSQLWRDPETKSVTISARELAILAGRPPAETRDAHHQLFFGASANDGPSSMAQRYARLLGNFQEEMTRVLGDKTVFHLRLFKRFNQNDDALARGEAHFVVLTPVQFLRAKSQSPGITAVARANTPREGVIFASTTSGAHSLTDLRKKGIVFPDPDLSISASAKARLIAAGISALDLKAFTNVVDQGFEAEQTVISTSETIARVLRGETDAGVTYRAQFERHKHRGLVALDTFPDAPDVLAARARIDPAVVDALRAVIGSPDAAQSWPEARFATIPETEFGTQPAAKTSPLDDFGDLMSLAARFDAER